MIMVMTGGREALAANITRVRLLACMESDVVHEAHTGGQDLVAVRTLELLARGLVADGAALGHHHLRGGGPGLGLQRPGRLGDADPPLAQLIENF